MRPRFPRAVGETLITILRSTVNHIVSLLLFLYLTNCWHIKNAWSWTCTDNMKHQRKVQRAEIDIEGHIYCFSWCSMKRFDGMLIQKFIKSSGRRREEKREIYILKFLWKIDFQDGKTTQAMTGAPLQRTFSSSFKLACFPSNKSQRLIDNFIFLPSQKIWNLWHEQKPWKFFACTISRIRLNHVNV